MTTSILQFHNIHNFITISKYILYFIGTEFFCWDLNKKKQIYLSWIYNIWDFIT